MEQKTLDIRLIQGLVGKQEKITRWLEDHRRNLFIGAAILILLSILVFTLLFQAKTDWALQRESIEKDIQKLERFEFFDPALLIQTVQSTPEFAALYEGRLAVALVQNGEVDKARALLYHQQERITPIGGAFETFNQSNLYIAEGNFLKAWDSETVLKGQIDLLYHDVGEKSWIDILFAENLIKSIFLAARLDKTEEFLQLKNHLTAILHDKSEFNLGKKRALERLIEAYKVNGKTFLSDLELVSNL